MKKWNEYSNILDRIFFTDNDVIQKRSSSYDEFWTFLSKYERFRSAKKEKEPSRVKQEDNQFLFPSQYNKRYKINVALSHSTIKARYKEQVARRYDDNCDCKLTLDDVFSFYQTLLYYFDFLQKQKFAKLMKLKNDQNNLPIKSYEENIVYAIKTHQVVIIAGDTGCGKSTQVPQYLLAAGFKNIACTQPRRIACMSLAKRVGYETLNEYGSDIAYQVRFDTNKAKNTRVLFLTEGLLLRQFQSDPLLSMYDVVVVDEVHERHINGDFLLGVLKCLLQQRDDLKLVLMSATINIELFTNYFNGAPVIQVPGRLYPIELQYLPHFVEKSERGGRNERLDPSPYLKVMELIDRKYPSTERGDLLIFLSGMSEISSVVDSAREYALKSKRWIILPLHSSLSIEDQDKIFDIAPEGVRKCIVSTNIAETSITIDGVRFIADSGKVKEMNFDSQVKMQRLQEFWISQASSEQRKGRAGRTGPGVCFRLFSEEDYHAFNPYSTPEIQRVPLDSLVLQMASLGLHDATLFPFIEPPPRSSLVNAIFMLKQQNALTKTGELTSIGRMLSRLPVDVVIGKMLIMGSLFNMVDPVLVIAAALSVQSPMTKKFGSDSDSEIDHRRKDLYSHHGDPFTLLNAYDEWIIVKSDGKSSSKKWCKRRGLEEQRFYEISKLKRQFEDLLQDHGLLKGKSYNKEKYEGDRGKRSQLLKLKREHQSQSIRKKKVLKLEALSYEQEEESDDESVVDIHDIDFKLRHNLSKLATSSKQNRSLTYRDVNILKLIISSGLYPQVVLADESNVWRKITEQVFHSKEKQFLLLHPTGVFSLQPDFLESLYKEQAHSKEKKTEGKYSDVKEFLTYVSLLETNKAYVVNTMKVPILQTLFLLSSSIDTNSDCTQCVFDGWIELTFEDGEEAKKIVLDVVQLRKAWDTLLEEKLSLYEDVKQKGFDVDVAVEDEHVKQLEKTEARKCKRIKLLEDTVSLKLAQFIDADISYNIRRLSSVEHKHIYVGSSESHLNNDSSSEPFQLANYEKNSVKGGYNVTSYITYGCLRDDLSAAVAAGQADYLIEHYHCQRCKEHLIGTVIDRIKHNENCPSISFLDATPKVEDVSASESNEGHWKSTLKKSYYCESCTETLQLTPTEILKHKVTHQHSQK